jgi:hypothetical protein
MQNIDYSRRFRSTPGVTNKQIQEPVTSSLVSQPSSVPSSPASKPLKTGFAIPGFAMLVGSILIFTSGVMVGILISQKEDAFRQNEVTRFKNPSSAPSIATPSAEITPPSEEAKNPANLSSLVFPGAPYPFQEGKTNYLIEIKGLNAQESRKKGKEILKMGGSLGSHLFKTPSGGLYIGYFQKSEEANEAFARLKNTSKDVLLHQL